MFEPTVQSQSAAATILEATASDSSVARDLEADREQGVAIFLAERSRLFRVAYRIVGDLAGADDVVQEAWLRWQRCNRAEIQNPAAFLTTATTHLAINVVQSAVRRHETPIGSPLAEPVDRAQDPTRRVEQTDELEQALSLLMARLTPAETAAYLLRKGFDYPYREIARVLRTTVANARQLVRRAQGGLDRTRPLPVNADAHRRLVVAFVAAARAGDVAGLERVLAGGFRPARSCPGPRRLTARTGPRRIAAEPKIATHGIERAARATVAIH